MAKKNKGKNQKNKQNNNAKPVATKPIVVTNPEVIEANGIIEESKATANKIISDAKLEADQIIQDAKEDAEVQKQAIIESYQEEAKEIAAHEYDDAKDALKADHDEKIKELNKQIAESKGQEEEFNKSKNEYEVKMESLIQEKTNLEKEKKTYKTDILDNIYKELDINNHIAELENKILNYEQENRKKEHIISTYEADEEYYQEQLNNLTEHQKEYLELKNLKVESDANIASLEELLKQKADEIARLKSSMIAYGDNPSEFIKEKRMLEEENVRLKDKLALLPSLDEYESLITKNSEFEQKVEEIRSLKIKNSENESKLIELDTYINDLDNAKKFIRVLELQREELQVALGQIQDLYNQKQNTVFSTLTAQDSEPLNPAYKDVNMSLKDICTNFRNYLANRKPNPLYYSERSIRTFIAGLAASRLIILQGMSGTGKSSLPKAFEEYFGTKTDRVPVQSSWKDRNDLLGFYNDFEKRFKETTFLKALYSATRDTDNIHLIMLDEMNISRIEYYFADFLSVLEEEDPSKWTINLLSNDVTGNMPKYITNGEILVRENTWFIGTANRDDSTQDITDKVYDRAIVLDFDKREDDFSAPKSDPIKMSYKEFADILKKSVHLSSEVYARINGKIKDIDEIMQTYFEVSFGNRIGNQILQFVPAFVRCGGTENEAIDIIISTKVVRKLENVYKNDMATVIDGAREELQGKFGSDLELTEKALIKLKNTIG